MGGSNCLRHTIFFGNGPAAAAISRSFIKHNSGFIFLACRRICIINTVILYAYSHTFYIHSTVYIGFIFVYNPYPHRIVANMCFMRILCWPYNHRYVRPMTILEDSPSWYKSITMLEKFPQFFPVPSGKLT